MGFHFLYRRGPDWQKAALIQTEDRRPLKLYMRFCTWGNVCLEFRLEKLANASSISDGICGRISMGPPNLQLMVRNILGNRVVLGPFFREER